LESDLFGNEPTIVTADLHSYTDEVFHLLDEHVNLDQFVVVTAGDMAGPPIFGADGDPTDYYVFMHERCKEFYFIQGNHDLPDYISQREGKLRNTNTPPKGNFCDLTQHKNGQIVKTSIGTMAGVHGTISTKKHPFKSSEQTFLRRITQLLKRTPGPRILVTHETPSVLLDEPFRGETHAIGNAKLYNLTQQHKPQIHIFGHCHHYKYHSVVGGVHYLNADARVLIFKPPGTKLDTLLKTPLYDRREYEK
jgi:Icc-related predicted phosphoesterase